MDGLRKFLAKHVTGFRFKDRRGNVLAIVTKSDDRSFTIQQQKFVTGKGWQPDKSTTVSWEDFYARKDQEKKYSDFKGQFSRYMANFIRELVMKGREHKKIAGREWSEHMLGAALTLKHLYGEEKDVDTFISTLVKDTVKGFGRSREWAVKWFPDVELPEAEDPVE